MTVHRLYKKLLAVGVFTVNVAGYQLINKHRGPYPATVPKESIFCNNNWNMYVCHKVFQLIGILVRS